MLECISAATISLVMLLVITLSNPHLRYKNQLLTWCVEYPVFFSFVQAPHNYKKARRMAALAPDRLERVARVVERALVSVLIGAVASLVLFAGAVHGSTALRLFPIFATMAFGILLLILEPSEGVNRPQFLQSRFMPMKSFLSCNSNERRLVKFALTEIYSPKKSRESLDHWSRWTVTTRSAVLEWFVLLSALGSGFVAMTVILAPHCMTRTNEIGYFLVAASIVVVTFMIKGVVVSQSLRNK